MKTREVTIQNIVGLHARPATFFIQKANTYKSTISVEKDDKRVNAKSLLGVLSLGVVKGMTVNLIADGPDEDEALAGLAELIDSCFGE
jgi:phosphocarrier protein